MTGLAELHPSGPRAGELQLAGAGAESPVWGEVLTGCTALPARRRRSGQAASVGAALLTAAALGEPWDLDVLNPVVACTEPDPATARYYERLRPQSDRLATALVELGAQDRSTSTRTTGGG